MVNRIRELLEARQLSPTQFADLIGVGRPVISHILSERNKPSLEVVQKVLDAFPDVSLAWLMKGTGSMLTNGAQAPILAAIEAAPPVQATQFGAAPPLVTPPTASAPVAAPSPLPQPQAFVAFSPNPPTARSVSAPLATARALPPKFRPAAKSVGASPAPAEATTLPPVEPPADAPATTNPVATSAPVAPAPEPVALITPPSAATQLVAPPSLDSNGPTGQATAYQQAAPIAPQPVPNESPIAPATVGSALPAAEPPMPNPAAALSFLGEPGKAIRRIVIFYRDGSFSDYVPEGQ